MPKVTSVFLAAMAAALFLLSGRAQAAPPLEAPPLEAYGRLPGFDMAALSPSGARYAVVGAVGDKRELAVIEGGKPILAAPVGDQKVRKIAWAGEDIVLVWASRAVNHSPAFALRKSEVMQVVVLNIKTGKSFWILDHGRAGNGVYGSYGITEEDGRWYAYFGGITLVHAKYGPKLYFEDGAPDLYKVDLQTGAEHLVGRETAKYRSRTWVIGSQGEYVATLDYDLREGDWRVREGRRGDDLAIGVNPLGQVWMNGKGRTEGTVLYGYRDAAGEDVWFEVAVDGSSAPQQLFGGKRVLTEYRDRRSGLLIGFLEDGDYPKIQFFDPERQRRIDATLKAFPGEHVRLEAWNDDFDRLIVMTEGPEDSGTWWLVDITTGKAEQIGRPYPLVPGKAVGPVSMVSWTAPDGTPVSGVLTLPPHREGKALPAVVLVHGGPEGRDYPQFDWWAQALASRGYAVLQPNYRGSVGYGAAFRAAGDGQWGLAMESDISSGVAELGRRGVIDPARVCITGGSYGGYAALAGVTLQNGLYRCAVAVAAPADLPTQKSYWRIANGPVDPVVRFWDEKLGDVTTLDDRSPARQAARADAPILLIHGEDDTVVPPDQSKRMLKALQREGKPAQYIELEDEDHWLSRGETRLQMLEAMVGFIERHNPPD